MNPAEPPSPPVVCVLGMHRSGTSAVTRLLALAGLDPGHPDTHAAAGADNPRGYWEIVSLRQINEALLQRFGGSWLHPPQLPEGWAASSELDDLRARARAVLSAGFSGQRPRLWKDPRACLTLPFWRTVIPGQRFVICIRNPLSVMASLRERDGLPAFLGRDLWSEYVDAALWNTQGETRVLLHYEEVMDDPGAALHSVLEGLGLAESTPGWRDAARGQALVEQDLQHHRHTLDDIAASTDIDRATKLVYSELWHGRRGELDTGALFATVSKRLGEPDSGDPEVLFAARGAERRSGRRVIEAPDPFVAAACLDRERSRSEIARWFHQAGELRGDVRQLQEQNVRLQEEHVRLQEEHVRLQEEHVRLFEHVRQEHESSLEEARRVRAGLEKRLSWVEVRWATRLRPLLEPFHRLRRRFLRRG